jgi:hypothetical protein
VAGVGIDDRMEESVEGAAKLHCLWRGLLVNGPVGTTPDVVVDKPISTSSLWYTANRAQPKLGQMTGLAPW